MNRIFFSVLYLYSVWCFAQSYIGYDADNYSGIHGVLANPASMADSRLKVDINLVSVSVFGTTDYAEINYRKLIRSAYDNDVDFDADIDAIYIGRERKNSFIENIDVLGPSFMFTINKKHSVGLFSRARGLASFNDIDGAYHEIYEDRGLDGRDTPFRVLDENSYGAAASWIEFGASYARVLKNEKQHFLKVGISIKHLRPVHFLSYEFKENDTFFNFDPDDSSNNRFEGGLKIQVSDNLDPDDNGVREGGGYTELKLLKDTGFGLDLGLVYEYRPKFRKNISRNNVIKQTKFRHINTYKLRMGVSLLDIGSMTYKSTTDESYDLGRFPDELNNPTTPISFDEDLKVSLPANLRLDVDWAISKKFYLNTLTRLSLISSKKRQAVRYANQFTVSPRLETRWLSVFSPLSVTQYSGVQWGLGTRLGPIFLGSGNFLGSLFDNKTRAFDVYVGLKIPLFHSIPKTKEEKEEIARFECPDGCAEAKGTNKKGNNGKRLGGKIKNILAKKKGAKRMKGYRGIVK